MEQTKYNLHFAHLGYDTDVDSYVCYIYCNKMPGFKKCGKIVE